MEYDIECDKFWEAVKDTPEVLSVHIKDMTEFLKTLGMEYVATDYKDDASNTIFFKFRITNKKLFFLSKVKYGL